MDWGLDRIALVAGPLTLRQIRPSDFDAIAAAIHDPDCFFAKVWQINTVDKVRQMLASHDEASHRGHCNPLVYLVNGEVAGITRLFHFDHSRKGLEIGGTWLAPKWRRSFVNTQVKALLLEHVFSTLKAERVEFQVHTTNYPSQLAVLRIGARQEGTLRGVRLQPDGHYSDAHLYGISRADWPRVRERLACLTVQQRLPNGPLPDSLSGKRLNIRLFTLDDKGALCDLVNRNRKYIAASFPATAAIKTDNDAAAAIADRAHRQAVASDFNWGIWNLTDQSQLLGQIQVKRIDWTQNAAELGFFIDERRQREGLATEALELLLSDVQVKNRLRRLYMRILPDNHASLRVAQKLGFELEGRMRAAFRSTGDELVDVLLVARCEV